ncbi:MAG TPA: tRNA (adenosine(37)-N6)-threonylcarbamoyltransferase complex ATPase subunit type 1 TsaE [Mariprofundaceae bacterium]|nr:tRNA (adenosine(37)-N6)-threonylcarbamoyltransferase complex ATPase subunit type 1 TsaE [Mariprofundaceae bacterium]
MIFHSNNESETSEFAEEFSRTIRPGDVVALSGELGAGKSVFARALMRALGVTDEAMPSPTFAIIQEYPAKGCRVAHMDWYRLSCVEELEAIGVREYMQVPWITIVEWPERAASLLPSSTRHVSITTIAADPHGRDIAIDA